MPLINDLTTTLNKLVDTTPDIAGAVGILSSLIEEEQYQQRVVLDSNTKAVCTSCGKEDAILLYFRRRQGLYELLCRNNDGSGCYNNSSRVLCQHVDSDTVNCTQLAEHEIRVGFDNLAKHLSCTDHVGTFIGTASSYKVFPLDKGR